jgi:hypothetical protein
VKEFVAFCKRVICLMVGHEMPNRASQITFGETRAQVDLPAYLPSTDDFYGIEKVSTVQSLCPRCLTIIRLSGKISIPYVEETR